MNRRAILKAAAGLLVTTVAGRAQQARKPHRIAIVHPSAPLAAMSADGSAAYRTLFAELRRLGYVEGQNLVVERRSGGGRTGAYPDLAREVVRLEPDLIYSSSRRLVQHLKVATTTIPIVAMTSDPVVAGLAATLARPGGNITGVSTDAGHELLDKRLEIIREAASGPTRLAFLAPAASWEGPYGHRLRALASRLNVTIAGAVLGDPIDEAAYGRVFDDMARDGIEAVMVGPQQEHVTHAGVIVALAAAKRLPAVYPYRDFVEAGGLVAYGVERDELWRAAAGHIVRVLEGASPGELPIAQPTKFELTINLRAARVLNLNLPQALLARADEVIE